VSRELGSIWESVSADAGLTTETIVILPAHAGTVAAFGAIYFAPGESPDAGRPDFPLSRPEINELSRCIDDHVIVLNVDNEMRLVPLVLRHEAEHVIQQLRSPEAAELATLIAAVESEHAAMAFNPVLPHEREADASSRAYAVKEGIAASERDLESSNRFLFKAPWTREVDETQENLSIRLLAWVLMLPRIYPSVERSVSKLYPDEPQIRQRLAYLEPQSRLEKITAHGIDEEAFKTMTRLEQLAFQDQLRLDAIAAEREIARAIVRLE
jgi:hypothetical protein